MNSIVKFALVCLGCVPIMVFAQSVQTNYKSADAPVRRLTVDVVTQSSQTIYKFVDESGRVTYANSPIKGGTKLDLEPLTVIQSSASAANVPASAARAIPVAKVTSVPSSSYSAAVAPITPATNVTFPATPTATAAPMPAAQPPAMVAALDTSDKTLERAQQRRAEIRQRILQSEIQAEEKSLIEARAALSEEQRRSGEIRTMRASFSATAQVATAQKPLISPETRAEIERHFERVRNLQDQVMMHESNIGTLREEMVAHK
jgi:hypothetical protein